MDTNTIHLSQESLKKLSELLQNQTLPSGASQIILAVVPIVGVLFGGFLFFSLFYFYHKQKTLMIEKGIYRPVHFNWSLIFIVTGFIIGMSGMAITVVFLINGATGYELLGGGIPLAIGFSIVLSYFLSHKLLKK